MPTIDIYCAELEMLLDWSWQGDIEKLDWLLAFVKGEVKLYNEQEGIVSVELKDTNRPDLWSVEGLARVLRGFLKLEKGPRRYTSDKTILDVQVDAELSTIRPFICCSVVKNVALTDTIIRGLMHSQDKLDQTYGRSRQKTSIGLYNYDLVSSPLKYTVTKPSAIDFIPLGFEEKMNLAEILERHPKGVEYGHIVKKHNVYPILLDSNDNVLSFPPIINSNDLGRVTEETQNVLVEVTGTAHQTVFNTLNLVTLALIDRGGTAYATTVHYPNDPFYSVKQYITPLFDNRRMDLDISYSNKILGLQLSADLTAELLLIAGLGVEKINEDSIAVQVPCYRVDIMHPVDLVEDIAIAYGYNKIEPYWRELPTTGGAIPEQRLTDVARELMIGLGFQEILTYTLNNTENMVNKMNFTQLDWLVEKGRFVEIANPKVETMACLRNWLLPSVMEFLGYNQSIEFPQKIFELGKVTLIDETKETKTIDEEWLASAITHPTANFSEIKSVLDAFFMNFGVEWQISETSHPSFIEGRVGTVIVQGVNVGVLGEIHPQVIETWKLENPVVAFEINLHKIIKTKLKK
jgi:phenylalanyl-tRNA synthetase beta chain